MATIPHRQLRNESSAVSARVAASESITVTNHGEPVAMIVPLAGSVVDRLMRSGEARPARSSDPFTAIRRVGGLHSAEILDDLRGDR